VTPPWKRRARAVEPEAEYVDLAAMRFGESEEHFGSTLESSHEMGESSGVELTEQDDLVGRVRLRTAAESLDAETDVPSDVPPTNSPSSARVPAWRQMLQIFMSNRLAVISMVVLFIIVAGCFIGPHFYVTNQTNSELLLSAPQNLPPNGTYWLGTDQYGWDVLGRIMFAGQYSLILGLFAGLITIVIGTAYGLTSGYFGGAIDGGMMRLLDAFLSIPYLFLLVALVTIFGRSTTFLILVIGLTGWWGNARILRGDALTIRDLEYAQASRTMGAKGLHIIRKHVFPNSISSIVTVGTFSVADAILFLSALGFLGLGIQSPATDWGTMMSNGTTVLINNWWWELYPVAATFVVVVVCINYIGDALRDVFEVRLRKR
jgi:peptide/nickel transport system permease protein